MDIDTLLPESGTGFVTNNRCDNGACQFGQKSTIDAAIAVAAAWNGLHSQVPFSIGQIIQERRRAVSASQVSPVRCRR